jgi:hypothetical protein
VTELLLGPVLRHVTQRTATVWVETDGPCTVEVLGHRARTFHVAGHHYALVVVSDLEPGARTEYDVKLDGERRWPEAALGVPPSTIATLPDQRDENASLRILFGSCRTAAPHEPPWSLELALDARGRGVDALRTHAMAMALLPPEEWPELVVLLGDQVYADDSSPRARERVAARREHTPAPDDLPHELVYDFEEYTWLYQESWSSPWERWLLSVVPSVMIFDDHDMIDDWNISDTWVDDIRAEGWWTEHVVGGLTTYWLYQHLGNLSPAEIEEQGMLAALLEEDDGAGLLRDWALRSEEFTPVPGGYRFSFARDLGRVKLVVIDSRNGRVLAPGERSMVDDDEWAWFVAECEADVDHLLIGTSLPAFTPGGMHDLQEWNEALIDGAWGSRPRRVQQRVGERLRRGLDIEDWPAFHRSFEALVELIGRVGSGGGGRGGAPATISILSGDIHFSFHAQVHFPAARGVQSRVHQLVSSPIRNVLRPNERFGMRLVLSRPAALLGRALRRSVRRPRTELRWSIDHGPVWGNSIGLLTFTARGARVALEQSRPGDDDEPTLTTAFDISL